MIDLPTYMFLALSNITMASSWRAVSPFCRMLWLVDYAASLLAQAGSSAQAAEVGHYYWEARYRSPRLFVRILELKLRAIGG